MGHGAPLLRGPPPGSLPHANARSPRDRAPPGWGPPQLLTPLNQTPGDQ